MRILLIRHGEPDYEHDSLTPKGFREAELLSRRMEKIRPDAIYASPMGRAQATLQPTLDRLHMQAETLPWLHEFSALIPDPADGQPRIPWNLPPQDWTREGALYEREGWLTQKWMAQSDVGERYHWVTDGLDALLARYGFGRDGLIYHNQDTPDVTIALFCHFAVSMVLVSHLTGVATPLLWQGFFMPTSSVTMLFGEERVPHDVFFRVAQMGDISHLYEAGEPMSMSGLMI